MLLPCQNTASVFQVPCPLCGPLEAADSLQPLTKLLPIVNRFPCRVQSPGFSQLSRPRLHKVCTGICSPLQGWSFSRSRDPLSFFVGVPGTLKGPHSLCPPLMSLGHEAGERASVHHRCAVLCFIWGSLKPLPTP